MLLIIDGYNLLHVGRSLTRPSAMDLQRERARLIDRLAVYRRSRACDITVVFDGWQSGWITENRGREKGIDLVFSKLGEKADEVIKRMMKEKGAGVMVITSDREIAKFADRISVSVVPSEQFVEKMEKLVLSPPKDYNGGEEEDNGEKKKGPSRRLSKKERKARAALKKL
jgi:predicted RNA-binding protein with PIN domain